MPPPATHPDIVGVLAEPRNCSALIAPRTQAGAIAPTGAHYSIPIIGWAVDRHGATHPLTAFSDELGDFDAVQYEDGSATKVTDSDGRVFLGAKLWLDHLRKEQAERDRRAAERKPPNKSSDAADLV